MAAGQVLGSFGYTADHEKALTGAGFNLQTILQFLQKAGPLAKALLDALIALLTPTPPSPNPTLKAQADNCPCPDPKDGLGCCHACLTHTLLAAMCLNMHTCKGGQCDTKACCREAMCHLLKALECCACHCNC